MSFKYRKFEFVFEADYQKEYFEKIKLFIVQ